MTMERTLCSLRPGECGRVRASRVLEPVGRFFGLDGAILLANGWTTLTAGCVLCFTLLHWLCSTTLLTVKKETGSWGWTALAAVLPTGFGLAICALLAHV